MDTRNLCATGPPAFGAITDAEADAGDTIIGYIANLPSICKPQPPREVLAITPIDFLVIVPKLRKLVPHLPPIDYVHVIWAKSIHVLSRADQLSWLSRTRGCHDPRRSQMQSRTDPNRARQSRIEQIASWKHGVRLHVALWRTPPVTPDYFTCGHVAEEVNAAMGWPIVIPHAEHFLCNYGEWRRC